MNIINYIIYISGIAIVILVLLQQRGSGLGSAFGQEGGAYATRRGAQETIYWLTIVCGAVFIGSALLALLI